MAKTPTYQEWLIVQQLADAQKECAAAELDHFKRRLSATDEPTPVEEVSLDRVRRNQSTLKEAQSRAKAAGLVHLVDSTAEEAQE